MFLVYRTYPVVGSTIIGKFVNKDLKPLEKPDYINLMKVAIDNSDAVIRGSEELPEALDSYINDLEKPVLDFHSIEEFADPYTEFYKEAVLNS